jgi:HK97 family phage major capsid protein
VAHLSDTKVPFTVRADQSIVLSDGRVLSPLAGGAPTLDELRARNEEIKARLLELDRTAQGRQMDEEEREEWNTISEEMVNNDKAIDEMAQRQQWLGSIGSQEPAREAGAGFQTPASRSQAGRENIWDLTTIRSGFASPDDMVREAGDRAKRAVENFHFPHPDVARGIYKTDEIRQHMERLLNTIETEHGDVALHFLRFGSPLYSKAFGKMVMGQPLTTDESRAMAVSTGSAGGYAVPVTLDPTLIPISNGTVNPLRRVARKETIVGLEYRGLTAGAVTASYGPEGTEASDNSPTLAQPDVFAEKAQAFVPYSIEIGMDWNGLQSGMAKLIADAKDVLEATKFTLGEGHAASEPSGLITGSTNTTSTASSGAFAIADLYNLEQALPPRFRPLGQWFGNRAIYNLIRQFGVSASEALWQPLMNPMGGPLSFGLANQPFEQGGNLGQRLLGYGANEVSDMVSSLTHGNSILAIGDPNYYLIVDRIGMTIEVVPHLFGANRRPTGQRGLYAYWRNTGTVIDPNAFRVLMT